RRPEAPACLLGRLISHHRRIKEDISASRSMAQEVPRPSTKILSAIRESQGGGLAGGSGWGPASWRGGLTAGSDDLGMFGPKKLACSGRCPPPTREGGRPF